MVGLLEDLDAELQEAGGAVQKRRAVGHLLLQRGDLQLPLLVHVGQQLLLPAADDLHQGVTLRHHRLLELRTVPLQHTDAKHVIARDHRHSRATVHAATQKLTLQTMTDLISPYPPV